MTEPTSPMEHVVSSEQGEIFVLPTSLGQERFWGLDRLNPGNPAWNVPVRFRLQGPLDPALLERAFNEIIRRHEVLRTTFTLAEGQPAQVIAPSLKIEVAVTDLRNLPKPERDAEVDRLSFNEARWRFDLTVGPLFRVGLLRVEDNEHVLLVNPHHSVVDYWSIGIISLELGALYEAYSQGLDSPLSELPIQYGDFAVWQREQSESAGVRNELAYWKEQLKNLPSLEFSTDHPRPSFPTYNATITSLLLPTPLTDAIRDLANREGTTFFNTMMSALSIVLNQHTGQTDFGIATQVAGRTSVEMETLIGLFINTVVLRADLSGDPSFVQLLGRVKEVGLESMANHNLRFEQLLRELRPEDYPSHHTLFRLNFICQRDPVKPQEFSGIKLTVIPSKSQGALYDLHVFLIMRNEGWRLACEYNTDLFEASTITGLLEDYRRVLESIIENPDRRVSQFPPSENAARRRQEKKPLAEAPVEVPVETAVKAAIASEAPAAEPYAMPASVAQRRFWVLEELAPGNPALHMRACVRLTGSLSLATLEKSLQALVDRHETLRTTIENVNSEIVQVVAPSRKIALPVTSIEDVADAGREARLWEEIRAEVRATFDLVHGPLMRARLFRLRPDEHVLVITTHHIMCDGWSQNVIQRDLWTIYEAFAEGREPSLPPLTVQYADFAHWQQDWLESDAVRDQIEFWKKQLAAPLPLLDFPVNPPALPKTAQGPMETLLLAEDVVRSLKQLSQSQDASLFMVMLTAYSALLSRYTGQEDILIGSPVANRRSETEPLIGPFAGPVSLRLNLSGNPTLRELVGRIRDVTLEALSHADLPFEVLLEKLEVRSVRGRNPLSQCYFFYQVAFLQPRELPELTVAPLPDFAMGTHFEMQMGLLERSEGIRAQLEYNPGLFEAATVKEILNLYQQVLGAFAADPDLRLSDLPIAVPVRSEPAPSEDLALAATEIVRAHDETEERLTKIWEQLLRVRPIGVHQNYFELGGHSLQAVRLFAEIQKVFGVKLPLSTLIGAPTIGKLATLLRGDGTAPDWCSLVAIQREGSCAPFFCVHGGGGNVLIYRDLSSHLGADQPFYGLQSQGLDGKQPLLSRIEDMAALYVKEVQKLRPHGPYLLGGYCMGGTVALEMAQQLRAQGEEVALVALFDTVNWSNLTPGTAWKKLYYQAQRLVFHAENFLLLNFADKLRFFHEKLDVVRSRSSVWRGMLLGKLKKQDGDKSESTLLARIWETNDRASLQYVPRPYPGIITDFRPVQQYSRYKSPGMHWDQVALEGQDVVTLPVYPAGMLLEPFVKDLGAALRASIDKAIQTTGLADCGNAGHCAPGLTDTDQCAKHQQEDLRRNRRSVRGAVSRSGTGIEEVAEC